MTLLLRAVLSAVGNLLIARWRVARERRIVMGWLARLGDQAGTTEQDWVKALKRKPTSITDKPGGGRFLHWRLGWSELDLIVLFDRDHHYVTHECRPAAVSRPRSQRKH